MVWQTVIWEDLNLYRLHSGLHVDILYKGKKYLCLCVYMPFSSFEFTFYLRFLFNTLLLSTINISSPHRINWMKQQHWIAAELLNYCLAFLYFLPFIEYLLFHFIRFPFWFLVTYSTALLTLCACVGGTETNKGYVWDEKSKLAFLGLLFTYFLPAWKLITAWLPL